MMTTLFGFFSLAVFTLSVLVHVATFLPTPVSMSWTWPLHLGAMAACFAMILSFNALKKNLPANSGASGDLAKLMKPHIPRPLWLLGIAFFVYAIINFGLFITKTGGGSPHEVNGRYELRRKGAPAVEISKEDYDRGQALLVRGFSGHWIFFSMIPTAFFMFAAPAMRANGRAS